MSPSLLVLVSLPLSLLLIHVYMYLYHLAVGMMRAVFILLVIRASFCHLVSCGLPPCLPLLLFWHAIVSR